MCIPNESVVHRVKDSEYKMTLYVYPVAVCGKDMQKGKPIEMFVAGTDVYKLKTRTEELVFDAMSRYGGECFVEMRITKDDEYFDSDEWWCYVNLQKKTVKCRGGVV